MTNEKMIQSLRAHDQHDVADELERLMDVADQLHNSGDNLMATYLACDAERIKLRSHSILLNQVVWGLLAALGDIDPLETTFAPADSDPPLVLVARVVAALAELAHLKQEA
jgi:hypothetical protein